MRGPKFLNISSLKNRRMELRKNSTDAEKKLWSKLRKRQLAGFKFCRQFSIGRFILDFYCPKCRLGIELDGGQHAEEQKIVYDKRRTEYLNRNNIKMIRFWDNDVLKNIEGVLGRILEELTPPTLPLK
jgi:very-short-patch-repair endonuclease